MEASDFVDLSHKDSGPDFYNKWASNYDAQYKNTMKYTGYKHVSSKWRSYHKELGSDSIEKIFDAGCGTGLVGEDLVTLVPQNLIEIYGGDLSPGMLEIARAKNVYADLRVVNLREELPYEADYFDSVLCAGVFTEGHCGPECLPNLIRVLKKGRYLFATVRLDLYNDETKPEWERQVKDCNCELIEDTEMPYREGAKCAVVVVRKL